MDPEAPTVTALIPAKAFSRRVPSKNLRQIAGTSLIERKIIQLKECAAISRIVVGSDSDEILDRAQRLGAIPLLRDAFHCDEDRCSANEMIYDMASRVEGDVILWAHCTNPFVGMAQYSAALDCFFENIENGFDSLFSVTRIQNHLWNQFREPINFNPRAPTHQLASTLAPYFFQDGAIFVQHRHKMINMRYFYGMNPFLFELSKYISLDIDTEDDFLIAQAIEKMKII